MRAPARKTAVIALDSPRDALAEYSEEGAVRLAQNLAASQRPDVLREDIAAHCDDAVRLSVLHALLAADADPGERLCARIARRQEAMLALDHAELHFTMQARRAGDVRARQLADALRHAAKSTRAALATEIDALSLRHEEEEALRATLSRATRRA
ncbi:hypothetical protein [Sagittula salina]|uniref:Uncharacterized protein n=1 Tax=Sagittula salina TaxID=2820268 RepID=A0A940MSE4_9RHOB|nr:hypothetical protein [Sagittula salina]MBP0483162.1 hypothetical protein [Sagittula salina]